MDNIRLRKYRTSDDNSIKNIFNYFSRESFACYNEDDITDSEIKDRMTNTICAYVYENEEKVVGFGYLSKYKNFNTFNHTGVLTYFLLPEFTGKGLGKKICDQLFLSGKSLGITNFIAHISSKNEPSISFHKKLGFEKVGQLKKIAKKFDEDVDIIWVQKIINEKGASNE